MKKHNFFIGKHLKIANFLALAASSSVYLASCNTSEHSNNFKYAEQCNNGTINKENIFTEIEKIKEPKDKDELAADFLEVNNLSSG